MRDDLAQRWINRGVAIRWTQDNGDLWCRLAIAVLALVRRRFSSAAGGWCRRRLRRRGLDMHDDLGSRVTFINMSAAMAQRDIEHAPENARRHLSKMTASARDLIHRDLDATCAQLAPGYEVKPLAGADFYPRVRNAFCVIATGERCLFANVILRKGVVLQGVDE